MGELALRGNYVTSRTSSCLREPEEALYEDCCLTSSAKVTRRSASHDWGLPLAPTCTVEGFSNVSARRGQNATARRATGKKDSKISPSFTIGNPHSSSEMISGAISAQ
jgi:hypothetical protein